jgi:hypothetical protein
MRGLEDEFGMIRLGLVRGFRIPEKFKVRWVLGIWNFEEWFWFEGEFWRFVKGCVFCVCVGHDWMSAEGLYGLGMVRVSNSTLATSCSTAYTCEFMSIIVCFVPS